MATFPLAMSSPALPSVSDKAALSSWEREGEKKHNKNKGG